METRHGRWLVIEQVVKPEHVVTRGKYYLCECQCSAKTRRIVCGRTLKRGTSKSCGCISIEKATGKSETGKTYGNWVVIEQAEKPIHRKGRGLYFLCECQCDNKTIRILSGHNLRQGITMSCGCKKKGIRNKDAPYNFLMFHYKRSAKKRKIYFSLTIEDFKEITQGNCYYCGRHPSGILKPLHNHDFSYNGIDRFDNTQGYLKDNCVPCCKMCNTAKMDMSFEEFRKWVFSVYGRLTKEKENEYVNNRIARSSV